MGRAPWKSPARVPVSAQAVAEPAAEVAAGNERPAVALGALEQALVLAPGPFFPRLAQRVPRPGS